MTEAQVGNGYAAGFFTVVGEVALSVHIGVITDDFDSALVGAYGTVTAQAQNLQPLVPAGVTSMPATHGREVLVTSSVC